MNLLYLSVVCKVIKSFHLKLNFRKGLSCYQLGIFFYIFIRILPGLLSTCKFLSSRSFLGCQFDNFNIYLLRLETFFDNHLFLPPSAAKAEGPLGLASMQLPVFSWIGVLFWVVFTRSFSILRLSQLHWIFRLPFEVYVKLLKTLYCPAYCWV